MLRPRKHSAEKILNIYQDDATYDEIAKKYGVSKSFVVDIKNDRIHRDVTFLYTKPERMHYSTKLTTDQIRRIYEDARNLIDIADDYGVCASTVSHIKKGRRNIRVLPCTRPEGNLQGVRTLNKIPELDSSIPLRERLAITIGEFFK